MSVLYKKGYVGSCDRVAFGATSSETRPHGVCMFDPPRVATIASSKADAVDL